MQQGRTEETLVTTDRETTTISVPADNSAIKSQRDQISVFEEEKPYQLFSNSESATNIGESSQLRRSSRVSALNANRRIQRKEGNKIAFSTEASQVLTGSTEESSKMVQETAAMDVEIASPFLGEDQNPEQRVSTLKRRLKRKLSCGQALDQYDCKFGIRLDAQGDVVLMSDESEISSLNEADVGRLRVQYENVQKHEVSDEVQLQRDQQIRELEAILRIEEAKLLMMKKLRHSQLQHDEKKLESGASAASVRRLAPLQNSSGHAYAPKVAIAQNQLQREKNSTLSSNNQQKLSATSKLNGATAPQHMSGDKKGGIGASKSSGDSTGEMQGPVGTAAIGGIQLSTLPPQHLQVIQQLYERLSQNPHQMANLIKTLPPQTGQALTELLRQYAYAQASGAASQQATKSSQQQKQQQSTAPTSQSQIDAANKQARELTQQNISKARQQLRRELDQLVTKLPVPKAPLPDLSFVPNGGSNQPEFVYLLGLDLTVQRVLKDRQMFKKPYIPPYRCEECDTDFTPSWKAICGDNEEYHLYCERCVRLAQKRKVCLDYKALLNRAFQQIKEREKEFERHVVSGKFNVDPILPLPSSAVPTNVASAQKQSTTDGKLTKLQQQNNAPVTSVSSLNHPKDNAQPIAPPVQHLGTSQQSAALNLSKSASTGNASNVLSNSAKTAVQNQTKTGASTVCNASASTSSSKRGVTNARVAVNNPLSNTGTATSNAAAASAASNPLALLQQNPIFQQQIAAMAALSNSPILRQLGQLASNPVMLATLTQNPLVLQQLFAAMTAQHQQQQQHQQQRAAQHSTIASSAAVNVPSGAAHALAQIAQKSSQQIQQTQQQHHRASTVATSSSASHSSTHNSASNATMSAASNQQQQQSAHLANLAAATNPLLALQTQLAQNPQLFNQLSANPQFRQMMQMYFQQGKGGPTTSTSGSGKK